MLKIFILIIACSLLFVCFISVVNKVLNAVINKINSSSILECILFGCSLAYIIWYACN